MEWFLKIMSPNEPRLNKTSLLANEGITDFIHEWSWGLGKLPPPHIHVEVIGLRKRLGDLGSVWGG